MSARTKTLGTAFTLVLAAALGGCGQSPEPTPSQPQQVPTVSVPTLREPSIAPTFQPSPVTPAPSQVPADPNGLYPLNQAQALAYLQAGIDVAGQLSGGR